MKVDKKFSLLAVFVVFSLFIMTGCFLDKDDYYYANHCNGIAYGIAYPVSGKNDDYKIYTDKGNVLIPISNNNIDIDTVMRVYSMFTVLNSNVRKDSFLIDVCRMRKLLYKKITDDKTKLGNDPVYVRKRDIWQSDFTKALNIKFDYYGGHETHFINLFCDTTASNSDTVYLELRHNKNGDLGARRLSGFVSFDLNSIKDYEAVTDSIVYKVAMNRGDNLNALSEYYGVYKP